MDEQTQAEIMRDFAYPSPAMSNAIIDLELTNLAELEYPPNPFFRGPVRLLARWA
jgi:hypothetical protein